MKIWRVGEDRGERYLSKVEKRASTVFSAAVEERVRKVVEAVARRGDRALVSLIRRFDLKGMEFTDYPPARDGWRSRGARRGLHRCHRDGDRQPEDVPRAAASEGLQPRTRRVGSGDPRSPPRLGGGVRAGRGRGVPVVAADGGDPGTDRRGQAHRRGDPAARVPVVAAPALPARPARPAGGLPDGRRARGGRAGLRNRVGDGGGQGRRAGRKVGRGGQAGGVRDRRHRHDRGPVGAGRGRGRACRPRCRRGRPAGPGRARPGRARGPGDDVADARRQGRGAARPLA